MLLNCNFLILFFACNSFVIYICIEQFFLQVCGSLLIALGVTENQVFKKIGEVYFIYFSFYLHDLITSQRPPSPNTITLGVRISTHGFWGAYKHSFILFLAPKSHILLIFKIQSLHFNGPQNLNSSQHQL